MSTKIVARTAKAPNVGKARLELLNAIRAVGKEMLEDYQATTASWEHKPDFKQTISLAGGSPSVKIETTDEIYGYVDQGTKPHDIFPINGKVLVFPGDSSPKTQPGVLGSSAGTKGGELVFTKYVHHPGTKARKFSEKILKKWRGEFGKRMVEAMHKAALATGHSMKG